MSTDTQATSTTSQQGLSDKLVANLKWAFVFLVCALTGVLFVLHLEFVRHNTKAAAVAVVFVVTAAVFAFHQLREALRHVQDKQDIDANDATHYYDDEVPNIAS